MGLIFDALWGNTPERWTSRVSTELPGSARPDAERVIRVRSERWIDHPLARDVLTESREIVDQPPRGRMLNALLTAEPGMGKTMTLKKLVRDYTKAFDRRAGIEPQPVLYMLMPEVPTEDAFFGQVFAALGAPATTGFTAPRRREAAFRLLRECGRRALVIDEISARRFAAATADFSSSCYGFYPTNSASR